MMLCTVCETYFEKVIDLKKHIKKVHHGEMKSKNRIRITEDFQGEKVNVIQDVPIIQRPEFFRKNLPAIPEGNRFGCFVNANFCKKRFKTDRNLERHILEEHKESLLDINTINNVRMDSGQYLNF